MDTEESLGLDKETSEELRLLGKEFTEVTKEGGHAVWPYLQHLYKTRVRAYKEAVGQFVKGYKEGFEEAEKKDINSSMGAAGGGRGDVPTGRSSTRAMPMTMEQQPHDKNADAEDKAVKESVAGDVGTRKRRRRKGAAQSVY